MIVVHVHGRKAARASLATVGKEAVAIQSFFQKALARKAFASLATLLMLNRVQFIR